MSLPLAFKACRRVGSKPGPFFGFRLPFRRRKTLVLLLFVFFVLANPARGEAVDLSLTPQRFADWSVLCAPDGSCIAYVPGPGILVIYASDRHGESARLFIRVVPALGQEAPIALRIAHSWSGKLQTGFCTEKYCEAAVELSLVPALVDAFRKHRTGLAFYKLGTRTIAAPFSLRGFTAALAAIEQVPGEKVSGF